MLNISPQSISKLVESAGMRSMRRLQLDPWVKSSVRWLLILFVIGFACLFLPWTQNIRAKGQVTSLNPDEKPQTIQSKIDGRIEAWYVREGDEVIKGDTILRISEIKDQYFDPSLLERTREQIEAQKEVNQNYEGKAAAITQQLSALQTFRNAKLSQLKNKISQQELKLSADSMDWVAANTGATIASTQFQRIQSLYDKGLESLTNFENRKQKLQEAEAKLLSAYNRYQASLTELIIARTELQTTNSEYDEKIAKASSEKFSALSSYHEGVLKLSKMENELSNYTVRLDNYFILAPQSGLIASITKSGIGENVMQGEAVCSILLDEYEKAVAVYVSPMDLPLIHAGENVRVQFDGWPAIIFSGWPNTSYGTFGGKIVAVDRNISPDGKYKVMISPDPNEEPWPDAIRIGTGVNAIALLNDVRVWYELWRQLNGFPPDFYVPQNPEQVTTIEK
jgi:adhesin transport system membrane fusion protein